MNLLLVSATKQEVNIFIKELEMEEINSSLYSSNEHRTELLLTGIGILATLFSMLTDVNSANTIS
ncbi:MAG: hypothetical protein PHW82_06115 [Bacteroidales bacterium]|nr:hypothetical protein [Bacteroidales bacterium]